MPVLLLARFWLRLFWVNFLATKLESQKNIITKWLESESITTLDSKIFKVVVVCELLCRDVVV